MPLLNVTVGHENVAQANSKVHVFHCPIDKDRTEMVLAAVNKEGSTEIVSKVGIHSYSGAVVGIRPEIGGQWSTGSYNIREGEILKVFATRRPSWKSVPVTVCQFIRMRTDAPMYKLKVKLLGVTQTKFKFAEIIGRFDILTLEEGKKLGARINPIYDRNFSPVEVAKLIEVEILEKEVSRKEELETVEVEKAGTRVRYHQVERIRSIELDN